MLIFEKKYDYKNPNFLNFHKFHFSLKITSKISYTHKIFEKNYNEI